MQDQVPLSHAFSFVKGSQTLAWVSRYPRSDIPRGVFRAITEREKSAQLIVKDLWSLTLLSLSRTFRLGVLRSSRCDFRACLCGQVPKVWLNDILPRCSPSTRTNTTNLRTFVAHHKARSTTVNVGSSVCKFVQPDS